jgi:YVTN family beta-propeller protein
LVDESLNRIITASIFDFGTFGTTIIDGATNTVIASIPAHDWCFDTALNRLTHRAYTAARLFVMQKIDVAAGSLEAITVTGSEAGFGVVNPNNHLLYASPAAQTSGIVSVDQNGAPGAITGLHHGNGSYFLGAVNKTTNRIYFSNGDADLTGLTFAAPGFVSVIDGSNNSVITSVQVGNRPFGIKANEATNKIYVANFGGNTNTPGGISVIDGVGNAVVSADVSAFPVTNRIFLDLAVNEATNKVYFWLNNGTVGVLDGATNVASQLPSTLGPAANIRVNKVLNRVYVATRTGVLHILDGATNAEIATLAIGSQNPADSLAPNIVVNETTGRVFVTDFNNGTLTVVDGATNSSVANVAVGSGPTAPAINELTNRVYVSNLNDKTLSIIDGAAATVKATLALPISLRSLSVDPVTSRIYGVSDLTDAQGGIVVVADAAIQSLGPAEVWIGLKNSDDAGTRFDLLAEVFKNNVPIGSGQLNNVAGGSSGFNNARLDVINLALADNPGFGQGDTFSIRLSVRIAATGHRSGTARLWFNDTAANSHFTATIGSVTSDYFLRSGFALGATAGSGPKNTIYVFADRAVGGNPFKPFGTWSVTF